MKLFVIALALFAVVAADVAELPTNEYLPPLPAPVSQEYLPPVQAEAEPAHKFGPDGYSYKVPEAVRRRYRYRVRRDVSELAFPSQEYLPPVEQTPSNEYLPPIQAEAEPAHTFGPDGYSYKNPVEERRRKYRIRRRRDVSELAFPTQEYLPPVEQTPSNEYLPPVQAEAEPAHTFGPDGYSYKNPVEERRRKYRIRRRRDVSELAFPTQEYLPPVEQTPSNEYLPPVQAEAEPAHTFGPDGYSYKNPVEDRRRKYRIRRRRDVSELAFPSQEYLPPVEQTPSNEYLPPVQAEAEPAHTFGPDGYSYKNPIEERRRKYRIRRRRDVSELAFPSQEYLPPVEQTPSNEYLPPIQAEAEPAHTFGPDGYSYKNPVEERKRKYRIRRRRDVSELAFPTQEYLPPVEQTPSNEYLPPVQAEAEPAHTFGPDGYSYKNPVEERRRKYRIRRRRDVSELAFPSQEYLPPVEQTPSNEYLPPIQAEAEPAHTFGPDGYSYKNPIDERRRKYRIRRRRDVSELAFPTQEYLPPVEQTPSNEYLPPIQAEAEPAHTFGPDGYSYKNPVEERRRYRVRRRRDVSALTFPSQEYLPPVSELPSQEYIPPVQAEAEPAHIFGPDGYSYKDPLAKRRYRIRYRH